MCQPFPEQIYELERDPPAAIAATAKEKFGWEPQIALKDMVIEMIESDMTILEKDAKAVATA